MHAYQHDRILHYITTAELSTRIYGDIYTTIPGVRQQIRVNYEGLKGFVHKTCDLNTYTMGVTYIPTRRAPNASRSPRI